MLILVEYFKATGSAVIIGAIFMYYKLKDGIIVCPNFKLNMNINEETVRPTERS